MVQRCYHDLFSKIKEKARVGPNLAGVSGGATLPDPVSALFWTQVPLIKLQPLTVVA